MTAQQWPVDVGSWADMPVLFLSLRSESEDMVAALLALVRERRRTFL